MKKRTSSAIAILLSLLISFVFITPVNTYAYSDTYVDPYYHRDPYWGLEKHSYIETVTTQATYYTSGRIDKECYGCGLKTFTLFSWKKASPDSAAYCSYNVTSHSPVYAKSKKISVWLDHAIPGSLVKVKIGNKTFKKRVGVSRNVKVKVKNLKYGSKITIKVIKDGSCIGECWNDEDNIVYYAKNIRKGMTKKQVRCLYNWGGTDDVASASGGWSYWYYSDGSHISFKNGRVQSWYDTAR